MKKFYPHILILIIISLFFGAIYYYSNTMAFSINSSSMYPSLSAFENRRAWIINEPHEVLEIPRQSIVVYKKPRGIYVGRILAFPGETIEVINSQLYINGKSLNEPYVTWDGKNQQIGKITVGEKQIITLRDVRSGIPLNFEIVPTQDVEANAGKIWKESGY